jgi:hypothetical protein
VSTKISESVMLKDGPSGLAAVHRPSGGADGVTRLSVPFYGRNHHFERSAEVELVDGQPLPVFRWTYATAIAE